ncbi:hypothetical protein F2Q70_00000054 [Brassica cretica]|uniref:RNase H type-1 domain-containing protein n=1 Tax=Brassica cretica TaxID=69181 RepID=A0A8S9IZ37_BRACR|nr:hypothetical protein F2Q70_00000054 [Brassica cretica]
MGGKKKPAKPKNFSGGGGKSGKTYRRSASTAVDEDMEIFGSLAIEHKEEGKKLSHDEGAMLKAAAITTESAEETNYMDDLDQEAKDHLLAQEEMGKKAKLGLDSLENPQPILIPIGLFLCDSNDNSETNKALRNHQVLAHPEAVELAAIIQGLGWALKHGVKSIQFFCDDDSIILDYVTGKAAPPNESIVVAKLLKQLALLQTSFTSCQALPLLRSDDDINSSLIKLARDAIASQTTWQREEGDEYETCPACYAHVSPRHKLEEENLSAMNTDPLYSAYHYSHPPLVERLRAIDGQDKKTD